MSLPLIEIIEARVLTLLSVISVDAGYNYDYAEISRDFEFPETVNEFPVIFTPASDATSDPEVQGRTAFARIPIWVFHNSKTEHGTTLNKSWQDVAEALFVDGDGTLGLGNSYEVIEVVIESVQKWQDTESRKEVLRLMLRVKYEHERGEP